MNGAKTSTGQKKRTTARNQVTVLLTVTEETMSTPLDGTTKRESVTRIAAAAGKKKTARIDTETETETETATETGAGALAR